MNKKNQDKGFLLKATYRLSRLNAERHTKYSQSLAREPQTHKEKIEQYDKYYSSLAETKPSTPLPLFILFSDLSYPFFVTLFLPVLGTLRDKLVNHLAIFMTT